MEILKGFKMSEFTDYLISNGFKVAAGYSEVEDSVNNYEYLSKQYLMYSVFAKNWSKLTITLKLIDLDGFVKGIPKKDNTAILLSKSNTPLGQHYTVFNELKELCDKKLHGAFYYVLFEKEGPLYNLSVWIKE